MFLSVEVRILVISKNALGSGVFVFEVLLEAKEALALWSLEDILDFLLGRDIHGFLLGKALVGGFLSRFVILVILNDFHIKGLLFDELHLDLLQNLHLVVTAFVEGAVVLLGD